MAVYAVCTIVNTLAAPLCNGNCNRRAPPVRARSVGGKMSRVIKDNRHLHVVRYAEEAVETLSEIRRIRRRYTDRLLTLLAVLLALHMFVFAPLHAMGLFAFQGFTLVALVGIVVAMIVISDNPACIAVMSFCLAANGVVFLLRLLYPPWPYNIYLIATAWFAISVTLGFVVAGAVFRPGRITYHRIIGAILLYLLIALAFATLFVFVGISIPNAFKDLTFEDNSALASAVYYLSLVTLTSTGYGDIVPLHPIARSLCNIESIIGQLYPATLLARLVTLEMAHSGAKKSSRHARKPDESK